MVIKMSNVSTFLSHHQGGKRWVFSRESRRVNDDRVVERPEVKFDYNFVKYSPCVKMTVGIGRRVVHIIFLEVQLCQQVLVVR